jgi:hypothetical protein
MYRPKLKTLTHQSPAPSALWESVSEQLADLERDQLPLLKNGDVGRMRSH